MNAIGEFSLRHSHMARVQGESELVCRLEDRNAPTPITYTDTVSVIQPDGTTTDYTGTITYDPASQAYMQYLGQYVNLENSFVNGATQFGSDTANGIAASDGTNAYCGGSLDSGNLMYESIGQLDQTFSAAVGDTPGDMSGSGTEPPMTDAQAYTEAMKLLNRNNDIVTRLKVIGLDIYGWHTSPLGTLIKYQYYKSEVRSLTKEAMSNINKLDDLAASHPNVIHLGMPSGH